MSRLASRGPSHSNRHIVCMRIHSGFRLLITKYTFNRQAFDVKLNKIFPDLSHSNSTCLRIGISGFWYSFTSISKVGKENIGKALSSD